MKTQNLVPWTRKAETWSASEASNPAVLEEAAGLPVYPAGDWPLAYFKEERPQFHVAETRDGRRFLVDTQGANYARYIAALPPKA